MKTVGVVVIGRNEGERLKACIRSLAQPGLRIVYVDSGSGDNSVAFVRQQKLDVVMLDMSIPFSAARARNEGYRFLLNSYMDVAFIQFIDGDCEIDSAWIDVAYTSLSNNGRLAAVCGRRKERFPERSIYNQLCDIEWDTPVGVTRSTGGDFMCRVDALEQVGGFSPEVIAGEEPELCFRLRQKGWLIERLDASMTLHDAAMETLAQWWSRCVRSGHAYAQGHYMHGGSEEKFCRREMIRIVVWSALLPFSFLMALFFGGWFLLLGGLYFVNVLRIFIKNKARMGGRLAFSYACFLMLGKFAEAKGMCIFLIKKICGQKLHIIEYKK